MSLDPDDLKNYRPVSNLSFLSNVLERIVLSQLNEHLNHNNLLSPPQSAYRPNHSTETALLRIVNDLLTIMDNKKICILTLLDLSAAFDAIDHQILLTRLQHSFGISGPALSWFSSYLSNRTHAVTITSLQSEHTTLHYGVSQGSVLGHVLFILYTQPLFNLVSKHAVSHHAFADDNQLYKISTLDAIHQSIETLQNCTIDVKSWMTANKLQLNDNKTEAMIILSNRMSVHSPLPSVIHIGDADVPFVSSVKNLAVTLDSNLSMSQHISNTCKAAYIQIRHISSIRHLLTTQATQTLVCSLVLSRLDYCNSGCPQYLLDKLQKVQGIFFSRVNFLCWLLFRYPFHPRVTAVTRKRPLSFCQKRRWQVTAKHAYTLRMWLCMKWLHGAWLYGVHRTRRDGSSFLWHQPCQRCKYTTSVDI